ncbi:hypothetical protein [Herminiimonas sp. CN]|nr:hypothetical protein [Herminiimonas sp. CN]
MTGALIFIAAMAAGAGLLTVIERHDCDVAEAVLTAWGLDALVELVRNHA